MAPSTPKALHPEFWRALQPLKAACAYEAGSVVFRQGSPACGIYLVEKGEVRLTLHPLAKAGQTFEIVGSGTVLGLSEVMTEEPYKLGAEAIGRVEAGYIEREVLLAFLRDHHQFCLQVVQLLSDDLHGLYRRFQDTSSSRPRRTTESTRVN